MIAVGDLELCENACESIKTFKRGELATLSIALATVKGLREPSPVTYSTRSGWTIPNTWTVFAPVWTVPARLQRSTPREARGPWLVQSETRINQKMARNTGPSRRQRSGKPRYTKLARRAGAPRMSDQSGPWASAARRSTDDGMSASEGTTSTEEMQGRQPRGRASWATPRGRPPEERRAAHNVFDTLRPRRACLAASSPRLSCPRHARGDNERARGVRRQHAAVAGTPYGPRATCVCLLTPVSIVFPLLVEFTVPILSYVSCASLEVDAEKIVPQC
jgi:hypothetical protein